VPTDRYGDFVEETRVRRFAAPNDKVFGAIPKEFHKRVNVLDAQGHKQPVIQTAIETWTWLQVMSKYELARPTSKGPGFYAAPADVLGRAMGIPEVAKDILNEGSGGGGSVIAPAYVEQDIITRLIRDHATVRPYATVLPMTGPTLALPVEAANVNVSIVAEGISMSDSVASTAFSQQVLIAKEYRGIATFSNELAQDAPALTTYLFEALAEITGLPSPKWQIPYGVALLAAFVDEAKSKFTGKPPRAPLAGVRMALNKMYFNPAKAIRELGLPQTPPRQALADAVDWFQANGYVKKS